MNKKDYIHSILQKLPETPGVYIMKDENDEIIYIGKAISLKKRVRSYFNRNIQDPKVLAMVAHIADIEHILTNNEAEALILENNLIKKNQPFYNILLRDDKTFPYIQVTNDPYPRILKTRNRSDKQGLFFGPYTDVNLLNNYLRDITEFFQLRDCNRNIEKSIERKERPCLNYHIGICSAPCANQITRDEYQRDVQDAIAFLKGDHSRVKEIYREKMSRAVKELRFEDAAKYRDRLQSLDVMREAQTISIKKFENRQDYVSYCQNDGFIFFMVLKYESGNLIAKEHYKLQRKIGEVNELIESFIMQYYMDAEEFPVEIFIDYDALNLSLLSSILSENLKKRIHVVHPKIGLKRDILELARKNAYEQMRFQDLKYQKAKGYRSEAQDEMRMLLGVESTQLVEAYDISNISGQDSVGVKVVFRDGSKSPSDYRKYRIHQEGKSDDYAAIREVLQRRVARGDFPDLIFLDGGRGHVSTIRKLFEELNVHIPVFGIYKDDHHRTKGLADLNQNYEIPIRSALFRFLTEIQDEMHRFAITYHRNLRTKSMVQSELDNIPEIGVKRKKALLQRFKTIEGIKSATFDELMQTESMNKKSVQAIQNYFKEDTNAQESLSSRANR